MKMLSLLLTIIEQIEKKNNKENSLFTFYEKKTNEKKTFWDYFFVEIKFFIL